MKVEESITRLSEFLPSDKRLTILNKLLTIYDTTKLAKMLNCNPSLINGWLEKGPPQNGYTPKLLGIAFQRLPDTQDVIKESLTEFDSLCSLLGIKDACMKWERFMKGIDEKSRQILWYMIGNGYAGIRELAEVTNADTDNEVLIRVRDILNPRSKKIFGEELMKFEESRIDPATGEKILFSWWLEDKQLEYGKRKLTAKVEKQKAKIKGIERSQKEKARGKQRTGKEKQKAKVKEMNEKIRLQQVKQRETGLAQKENQQTKLKPIIDRNREMVEERKKIRW